MKLFYLLLLFFAFIINGCGLRERELALEIKEDSINQKEQRLLLLEKQLQLKEEALLVREKETDTTLQKNLRADSMLVNLSLVGKWSVQMRCTETTCEGSAVGDIKNETWDIEYQNYIVIAKAMAGNKVVRVYSGTYKENVLQLLAEQESSTPNARITVRIQQKNPTELEGIREINRAESCRIVYALLMRKI
jgi:hypothetical protein